MDTQTLKNIFQIIIFIGTGLVLVGSVGNWYFGNKISEQDLLERKHLENDRDKITKELQRATSRQLLLNQFYSEIDNKIEHLFIELTLDKGYTADTFGDFQLFVEFNPLNTRYEIITKYSVYDTGEKQTKVPSQFIYAYPIGKTIDNPWKSSSMVNVPVFDTISADLWFVAAEKPKDLKIRDLQGGRFSIYTIKRYTKIIKEIKIISNNWIIFKIDTDTSLWDGPNTYVWPSQRNDLYHIVEVLKSGIRWGNRTIDLYSIEPEGYK